jgi:hypothetical protein
MPDVARGKLRWRAKRQGPGNDARRPYGPQRPRDPEAPRTRGQCPQDDEGRPVRPCPWVGCRFHLAVDITERGELQLRTGGHNPFFDALEDQAEELVESGMATCALDVVDEHPEGLSLDEVGALLNMSRVAVKYIEDAYRARMLVWAEGVEGRVRGSRIVNVSVNVNVNDGDRGDDGRP